MTTPAPRETTSWNGRRFWVAERADGTMLRDKRGVGRRFRSPEAAQRALDADAGAR